MVLVAAQKLPEAPNVPNTGVPREIAIPHDLVGGLIGKGASGYLTLLL